MTQHRFENSLPRIPAILKTHTTSLSWGGILILCLTLEIATLGTLVLVVYKMVWTDLDLQVHLAHESHLLVNLFGVLLGFAILSKHFEESASRNGWPMAYQKVGWPVLLQIINEEYPP